MLKPNPGYIPGIDGLRAIAVVAVLIYHADYLPWLPGGFTGVDMFFVISGFVISQSLSERTATRFSDYLLTFYRRRLLRLLPALLVVLVVSFILSAMLLPQVWLSEQNNRTGMAAFSSSRSERRSNLPSRPLCHKSSGSTPGSRDCHCRSRICCSSPRVLLTSPGRKPCHPRFGRSRGTGPWGSPLTTLGLPIPRNAPTRSHV